MAPVALRVGVFTDGVRQPRWIVEAIARAAASEFAELRVVCISDGPSASGPAGMPAWLDRVDRRLFGGATDWSKPARIDELVPRKQRLPIEATPEWRLQVADLDLDVCFVVGNIDDRLIDGLARHGTWRYCFGEDHDTALSGAGVREAIDPSPVTASGIRVRRPGQHDRVVCRSWSRTLPLSIARNRHNVFAKASGFLARALREVQAEGEAWIDRGEAVRYRAQGPKACSAGDFLRLATRVVHRAAEKATNVEQWGIAFRFADSEPWSASLDGFHRLVPPRDRFWADPFPITRNGKHYVFFEELPFAAGKAHISVIEVDEQGRASEPVRVLERDYHLSYPFLVEDGGELYMLPETAFNGTIEIYRCVDFPRRWVRERVLVDGVYAADATLHRADGRWWMFANVASHGEEIHDELHLFTADHLLGQWKALARNPVKSDVRSARPAGRLFRQGEHLYRPAQVCAPLYGSGVAIHRVKRLDEGGFEEEAVRHLVPEASSGLLGLHTINRSGRLSVADFFCRSSRLASRFPRPAPSAA